MHHNYTVCDLCGVDDKDREVEILTVSVAWEPARSDGYNRSFEYLLNRKPEFGEKLGIVASSNNHGTVGFHACQACLTKPLFAKIGPLTCGRQLPDKSHCSLAPKHGGDCGHNLKAPGSTEGGG